MQSVEHNNPQQSKGRSFKQLKMLSKKRPVIHTEEERKKDSFSD
jgi:hypothetical protein